MASPRKKIKRTLEERAKIIEEVDKNPNEKRINIANRLGISYSTLSSIYFNKTQILKEISEIGMDTSKQRSANEAPNSQTESHRRHIEDSEVKSGYREHANKCTNERTTSDKASTSQTENGRRGTFIGGGNIPAPSNLTDGNEDCIEIKTEDESDRSPEYQSEDWTFRSSPNWNMPTFLQPNLTHSAVAVSSSSTPHEEKDEVYHFMMNVSLRLRKLEQKRRLRVMNSVENILFKEETRE